MFKAWSQNQVFILKSQSGALTLVPSTCPGTAGICSRCTLKLIPSLCQRDMPEADPGSPPQEGAP